MACLRCSNCGISYPYAHQHKRCRVCGEATSPMGGRMDVPDEDWEYAVALKTNSVAEAEALSGIPADDHPIWWRAEKLFDAGLSYEQALLLAAEDVDLHEACALVERAGPELAYQILS